MNGPTIAGTQRSIKRFLLSPWGIAAILVGLFLVSQAYVAWRDRSVESVLEQYAPFATPAWKLEFSTKFPYDPLSFIGRGARAGFWKWSPEGLSLTEEGRKYFEVSGERIVSNSLSGSRRLKRIRASRTLNGEREIEFFYEWTEISPPIAALLAPAPRPREEYLGSAVLVQEQGNWTVQSLETRDFEESLAHLQAIASGIRK